jgi:PTS system nitrogen regulatory IIA component
LPDNHTSELRQMKITDFLSPIDAVVIEGGSSDKSRVLVELCERAARELGLDPRPIADAILARERLGSTGMGGGIAIPHTRLPWIGRRFGLLARLRRPIEYEAIDAKPVDVIFLLLSPAKSNTDEQLPMLACAARTLRNPAVIGRLRRAEIGADLYAAVVDDTEPPRVEEP